MTINHNKCFTDPYAALRKVLGFGPLKWSDEPYAAALRYEIEEVLRHTTKSEVEAGEQDA